MEILSNRENNKAPQALLKQYQNGLVEILVMCREMTARIPSERTERIDHMPYVQLLQEKVLAYEVST